MTFFLQRCVFGRVKRSIFYIPFLPCFLFVGRVVPLPLLPPPPTALHRFSVHDNDKITFYLTF